MEKIDELIKEFEKGIFVRVGDLDFVFKTKFREFDFYLPEREQIILEVRGKATQLPFKSNREGKEIYDKSQINNLMNALIKFDEWGKIIDQQNKCGLKEETNIDKLIKEVKARTKKK